jgi:hypothetical protein
MRIESSVTSIAWIPREAVNGITRLPFDRGIAHYDMPPPDRLTDLQALLDDDAIRFANRLTAWIEVEDGKVTGWGQDGDGFLGRTTMRLGPVPLTFAAVAFPTLRPEPEVTANSVRFVQSGGGRTGVPAPRRVRRKPFVQVTAPTAWSTLALTINADGTSHAEVVGASPFPRHWFFDHQGEMFAKSGFIDFDTWYRESYGDTTPWGGEDSPAIVTAVESALERELSVIVIGSNPPFKKLKRGDVLVHQGEDSQEVFLLFDGILRVEIDGNEITELGPGAILGEMAALSGGQRTATLRAVTPCRVAVVPPDRLDRDALAELAAGRTPPKAAATES